MHNANLKYQWQLSSLQLTAGHVPFVLEIAAKGEETKGTQTRGEAEGEGEDGVRQVVRRRQGGKNNERSVHGVSQLGREPFFLNKAISVDVWKGGREEGDEGERQQLRERGGSSL